MRHALALSTDVNAVMIGITSKATCARSAMSQAGFRRRCSARNKATLIAQAANVIDRVNGGAHSPTTIDASNSTDSHNVL
jgi:hypothetical protein